FRELVEPLGLPLRHDGRVGFIGGFYAQWEWLGTNLEYIGIPFLQQLLDKEVFQGWTELTCHPGYLSSDFTSFYGKGEEEEIRTVSDPGIRRTIVNLGIQLKSFADYAELVPAAQRSPS